MSKILVLAEKPSVGRDLARVLKCSRQGKGYFEGHKYVVTWALGHLVELAEPEAYGEKYATWKLEDLPIIPQELKLVVIRKSAPQFKIVKAQMQRKDVKQIVIATDAGREGELVARWIIAYAGVKKPLKRLWISSVTDKAIKEGFKNLKDGKEFENLYASAVARAQADWLVGINATRALTCKYNAQLSCGRVQTPTLAIIAQRLEEIKNFQPQTYYGITAQTPEVKLFWQDKKTKDIKTFDGRRCEKILSSLQGKEAQVLAVDKKAKKAYPPALYDLTELQQEAHKLFNFSAKETLDILQRLYERHKVLTYPRTDSRYLSSDMVDTLKDRIKACGIGPFSPVARAILKKPLSVKRSLVDDRRVSDHHAIIPTEEAPLLRAFSEKERKIYELVVKRFLAHFLPLYEYEETVIHAQIGEEVFLARGKQVIDLGWKALYEGEQEVGEEERLTEQILPNLKKGDRLKVLNLMLTTGETQPPPPFDEGSLLKAMENPVPYMDNSCPDLVKTLGQAGGLGTVATRADIIEKLFNSFLIEKKGRYIYITQKGRQLLDLVPEELKSPALTAQWEQKLEAIAQGKLKEKEFLEKIREFTHRLVKEIKESEGQFKHDNLTGNRCPRCDRYLLKVNSKKGELLVCQERQCGYRRLLSQITQVRCPQCHRRLKLYGEGEGRIFVCPCGYREKLTAYHQRKKQEKNYHVSSKEVAQFLARQKKESVQSINTSLADALAKLKLK